jgi:hypothetical protein
MQILNLLFVELIYNPMLFHNLNKHPGGAKRPLHQPKIPTNTILAIQIQNRQLLHLHKPKPLQPHLIVVSFLQILSDLMVVGRGGRYDY